MQTDTNMHTRAQACIYADDTQSYMVIHSGQTMKIKLSCLIVIMR